MRAIEAIIFVWLLIFCVQSCNNNTSVSYEFGKELRKAHISFDKGYKEER